MSYTHVAHSPNVRLRILIGLLVLAGAPFLFNVIRSAHAYVTLPLPQSGPAVFVRQLPLTVNDVVYSQSTHLLYASVPSSVGLGGNSIVTIDPTTGSIVNTVFIGSEPNRLALADDGTTLYVSLDGAFSIRKFDVSTQTPGAQFAVGQDSFFGTFSVGDLAVAPGNPNLVAVARQYRGVSPPEAGVAVFDNGVQRPTTGPGHISGSDYLSFSASATKLYGSGFYSGLTTLSITASGVSITNSTSLGSGYRVKFDNGTVYAGNGQVINPDTSTLLGTFSGVTSGGGPIAFVPESAAGRAYYLFPETFSSTNRTLRAFDINTFLPIASVTVPGVNGDVSNMVRWGSNGLAFRTFNQLFLVQTSLIPSADPITTPTPTVSPTPNPSPSPIATFVRQVDLQTNDLIVNSLTQKLYASVPSSVGSARGNSITSVDPVAGTVGSSVFVGSEPGKLALGDDLQTIYVGLNGAAAVRTFDLGTQTPGLQFSLGRDSFSGPWFPSDLAVMPGTPATVAVSFSGGGSGTALYDSGVRRSQMQNAGSPQFRSPTTLYLGVNGAVQKLSVTASGLSLATTTSTGSSGSIIYTGGLVYQSGGVVVDPEAGVVKGTFSGAGFGSLMAIDIANNKAFVLTQTSPFMIRAYDLSTFVPLGTIAIQGVNGTPSSLVRWGSNGLAFRTSNGKIFLIQTALVNSADSVPAATPTPSPTPSPSPPYFPTFVRKIDLQANDMVYNQATQRLYASVASFQGANGNSIATIEPQTAAVGPFVFVGSEPNKLALADDNQTLYMTLDGASAVRKFDIPSQTPGLQFSYSISGGPADIKVMPGNPQTVALSLGVNNLNTGVAIYDNGIKRANTGPGNYYAVLPIEFNGASTIYGYDSYSSGFELVKFAVSSSGVAPVTITNNLIAGYTSGLRFASGLLYSSTGRVVDPEAQKLIGTFQGTGGGALAVDPTLGKVFFVSNPNSNSVVLSVFDLNTFLPLGSATLATNVSGAPSGLVRWGANGLAFRAAPNFGTPGQNNPSAVYIVQSTLVSNAAPIPTGLQLSAATYNAFEGNSFSVTVNRNGDVSAPTTIDYATSDGTATAGFDYSATSGTLTFAAGEFSKTISIPIINDPLYEGTSETFTLTLSNPSGGALLTSPASAVVTIQDNDSKPAIQMASSFSRAEGNAPAVLTFPVTLSNPSVQTLTVDYTTADGTATAGNDFIATSGTLTFAPGVTSQSISVTVSGDTAVEPDENFFLRLSNATNASFISTTQSTVTLVNDDTSLQLSSATSSANESSGVVTITVSRVGLLVGTSTARFATSDTAGLTSCGTVTGAASERCDYVTSIGTVSFASGQSSKTFTIPLVDDGLVEGTETFSVALSNATGATLGATTTASVTIVDNDSTPATQNPIDGVDFFVRQQYLDILGRQPDQTGLQNWVNTLAGCPNGGFGEPPTSDCDRLHVAAGFFQSDEFLNRGYWAFRFYMVSFNQRPTYAQFIPDMSQVGGPKSPAEEEASKVAFADAFVQRPEFLSKYGSATNGQALADALTQTGGLPPFKVTGGLTNGQILRAIAERQSSLDKFLTEGTVSILYFGFQRRDPDAIGYQNNVNTLNADPNNLRHLIFIFIYSTEYRGRFGPP